MATWLTSSKQPHVSVISEPCSLSSQVQVSPNHMLKLNDEAIYDNDHIDDCDHFDDVYSWSISNEPEEDEDQIGSPKSVPSTSSSNQIVLLTLPRKREVSVIFFIKIWLRD